MNFESLLMDFFTRDDIDGLTRDIGESLKCPIIVADNAFRIVSYYAPPEFKDQFFWSIIRSRELNYELTDLARMGRSGGETGLTSVQNSDYKGRVLDLTYDGISMGYLVCVDLHGTLSSVEEGDFALMCAVLSKELVFKYHRDQLISSSGEALLISLLNGEFDSESAFQFQSSATYLATVGPVRLAVIEPDRHSLRGAPTETLGRAIDESFPDGHPFIYDHRILIFLNDITLKSLPGLASRYGLIAAVTEQIDRLYSLPQHYESAKCVLEYMSASHSRQVAMVEDFREYLMLERLSHGADLTDPRISQLLKHDVARGTEYVRTLYHYLDCHRSIQAACQRLQAHRNTVIYRIGRIKEEFDIDGELEEGSLNLFLSAALALWQIEPEEFVRSRVDEL